MDLRCRLVWVVLLWVWCTLDASQLVLVNGQILSVDVSRVEPMGEQDPVEGDMVVLECQTQSSRNYIIEWLRSVAPETQGEIVARDGISEDNRYTLKRDDRYILFYMRSTETLTFTASRNDTSYYTCRLRNSDTSLIESTDTLFISVLYFPSAMYPICIPDGPVTVQEGTTVNTSCTSERGNPPVQMQILTNSTSSVVYDWIQTTDHTDAIARSVLELTINASDDGSSYVCRIISTSSKLVDSGKSCIIGPFSVVPMTTELNNNLATTSNPHIISGMAVSQTTRTIWIPVSVLFGVFCIIVTFFLIRRRHLKIAREKETNAPKADPYTGLQATEDMNIYLEPTTAATTTQDTYEPVEAEGSQYYNCARPDDPSEQRPMNCKVSVHDNPTPSSETTDIHHTYLQPHKVANESPEYDYALPERSTNTSYEADGEPQSSAERLYQNFNNNNKKRRLGVVVSPAIVFARSEGCTNIRYEAARESHSSHERQHQHMVNNPNKKRRLGVVSNPTKHSAFAASKVTSLV